MANRRVIQEKIKNLQQNTANTWSQVGRLILERPNVKIDDTIGPIFDLKFENLHPEHVAFIGPNAKEREAQYKEDLFEDALVFIKIKVWDASQMEMKGNIYWRSYSEYQTTGPPNRPVTIFKRYRTPFKNLEYDLEYMEHPPGAPLTYKGNPDLLLNGGDVITVEIFTPYILDVKKSSISLELLVLDGHVGPEHIGIASMEHTNPLMQKIAAFEHDVGASEGELLNSAVMDIPEKGDAQALKDLFYVSKKGVPKRYSYPIPNDVLNERDLFDFVGIMQSYEFEYFELLREILLHKPDAIFVMTSVLKFMRDTRNLIGKQDMVAFFNSLQPERRNILTRELVKSVDR